MSNDQSNNPGATAASSDINRLARQLMATQLQQLEPYQSARRIGGKGQVYLNANELPFPPSVPQPPASATWHRYPDFLPSEIARSYAAYAGVPSDHCLAVRGADEAIDLLVRSFCEPGKDSISIQVPTYPMYEFVARAHNVGVESIPLDPHFDPDLKTIMSLCGRCKLVFLCHPNNPTGNLLDRASIAELAREHDDDALIVVDEAYIEFCPEQSVLSLQQEYPNIVIIRTLSKAFGLAAVRLGFILAHPAIIEVLSVLIPPYPIPDPCAELGLQALSPAGIDAMKQQRDRLVALRDAALPQLQAMSFVKRVYPSATNFLLVEFDDSAAVFAGLAERGIILRDQSRARGLANHLRISIGSESEMQELLAALKEMDS